MAKLWVVHEVLASEGLARSLPSPLSIIFSSPPGLPFAKIVGGLLSCVGGRQENPQGRIIVRRKLFNRMLPLNPSNDRRDLHIPKIAEIAERLNRIAYLFPPL